MKILLQEWLRANPQFNDSKIKLTELIGIAQSIRLKTDLRGLEFLDLCKKIWESSDLKDFPK